MRVLRPPASIMAEKEEDPICCFSINLVLAKCRKQKAISDVKFKNNPLPSGRFFVKIQLNQRTMNRSKKIQRQGNQMALFISLIIILALLLLLYYL